MITVRDYIEAIRKNGLPKLKQHYFSVNYEDTRYYGDTKLYNTNSWNYSKKTIIAACAAGQAAINLGDPENVSYWEQFFNRKVLLSTPLTLDSGFVVRSINALNDFTNLTLEGMAEVLFKHAESLGVLDNEI